MDKAKVKVHIIDARGRPVGRLASQVAILLQDKNYPEYAPNRVGKEMVVLTNISKAIFSGRKLNQKEYFSYSGYPGGIRKRSLAELWKKNPSSVFLTIVRQMLPANTLRKKRLARLKLNNNGGHDR